MPTVLRKNGFEIRIYRHDHQPPHVHVFRAGEEIVILLESGEIRESWMAARNARTARRLVEENRDFLLRCWNEIEPVL